MVALPNLIPTKTKAKTFGEVAYHIGAEAVPVLTVDVTKTGVFFEHHTLLWKHPAVKIAMKANVPGGKRMVAGTQVHITEAKGPGMIAFSRDAPGRIFPVEMPFGRDLDVREHQFIAATEKLGYSTSHIKGHPNHGAPGYFFDRFSSYKADGIVWLYAYGAVFEKRLATGESIDIEPGAWLYKESTVEMETIVDRLSLGLLGGHLNMVVNRFTGPGRVGVQSMSVHHDPEA
jgi:uncharacterized protein (AIM24 family)